ncbi:MAG: carboxypeptidase-like regulatory domain-containing protein [Spirulinaceae cyanobacterium]
MKIKPLYFLLFCTVLGLSPKALAHGANISYQQTQAIEIQAQYDGGTPMDNAQVTVYAPDDPATPWLKGTTDEEGKFTFSPDPTLTGNWDIKVRQAGHGDLVSIPFEGNTSSDGGENNTVQIATASTPMNSGYTPLQKAVMAAVGVWGCVGTALFFARRKSSPTPTVHSESRVEG